MNYPANQFENNSSTTQKQWEETVPENTKLPDINLNNSFSNLKNSREKPYKSPGLANKGSPLK